MANHTITKIHPAQGQPKSKQYDFLPKNIFQTHASTTLSEGAYQAIQSWRILNPDWTHYYFTDEDQRTFISEHFADDVLWAYDQLIPGAYKADLWRYCVLYVKGGIYVDHKFILNKPLNEIIPADCHFATFKDRHQSHKTKWSFKHYLWQGFIISEPKHPFLKKAIDLVVENTQKGYYGHDGLSITGPALLGKAVNLALEQAPTTPLQAGQQTIHDLSFTLFAYPHFSRHTFKTKMFDHTNVIEPYKTYRHEREQKTFNYNDMIVTDYASAWFLGKVFKHGKCERKPEDAYYHLKLRGFYRRKLLSCYKHQHYNLAKHFLEKSLKRQWLQPKIWWIWLKYECLKKENDKK
jgi:hypothetical protein